jgi:hypothetical protein
LALPLATKLKRIAPAVPNFKALTDGKPQTGPARVRLLGDEVAGANSDLPRCALMLAAPQP